MITTIWWGTRLTISPVWLRWPAVGDIMGPCKFYNNILVRLTPNPFCHQVWIQVREDGKSGINIINLCLSRSHPEPSSERRKALHELTKTTASTKFNYLTVS